MARTFSAGNCDRGDMFQIAYGYGLFTGGLGAHAGAERIGASVIPISSGNTEKQIQLMTDFGTTALCCTPSYALYLAEMIDKMGVGNKLKLKAGFLAQNLGLRECAKNSKINYPSRLSIFLD